MQPVGALLKASGRASVCACKYSRQPVGPLSCRRQATQAAVLIAVPAARPGLRPALKWPRRRATIVAAAAAGESRDRPLSLDAGRAAVAAFLSNPEQLKLFVLAAFLLAIVAIQVATKKLAVVSLGDYPVFMAQLSALVNASLNGGLLLVRMARGRIPADQLRMPKWRFAVVGVVDAMVQSVGYTVAAYLPGPLIPVLGQAQLLWLFVFARAFFRRAFGGLQYAGAVLVAAGVLVSVVTPAPLGAALAFTPAVIAAGAAQALLYAPLVSLSATTKEAVFADGKARFPEGVDIGLARALETLYQLVFVLAFVPLNAYARGRSVEEHVAGGIAALLAAPLWPCIFVGVNVAHGYAVLHAIRGTSALFVNLASAAALPLSALIFALPLPLLPRARLSPLFLLGVAMLATGLAVYAWGGHRMKTKRSSPPA